MCIKMHDVVYHIYLPIVRCRAVGSYSNLGGQVLNIRLTINVATPVQSKKGSNHVFSQNIGWASNAHPPAHPFPLALCWYIQVLLVLLAHSQIILAVLD